MKSHRYLSLAVMLMVASAAVPDSREDTPIPIDVESVTLQEVSALSADILVTPMASMEITEIAQYISTGVTSNRDTQEASLITESLFTLNTVAQNQMRLSSLATHNVMQYADQSLVTAWGYSILNCPQ